MVWANHMLFNLHWLLGILKAPVSNYAMICLWANLFMWTLSLSVYLEKDLGPVIALFKAVDKGVDKSTSSRVWRVRDWKEAHSWMIFREFSQLLVITSVTVVFFIFFLEGRGCCDSLTSWSLPRISYVRGPICFHFFLYKYVFYL